MLISRTITFAIPGQAAGDLVYFDGTDWLPLPIGVAGQALVSNGALPVWGTPTGLPERLIGTLNSSGAVAITLLGLGAPPGIVVVEVNVSTLEATGAAWETLYYRVTLDNTLTVLDTVSSSSGTPGTIGAITPANVAGNLQLSVSLTVASSVDYRISAKEV